jgi:ribosomal protein S18 acetylase RimI-like enzyme
MLRQYKESDLEELLIIFHLNVPEYFDPKEAEEFIDYLKLKSGTYLTILHENKIVGGIGYEFRESDSSGRINWIFIKPDHKGKGIGKEAVEYCLNILKSNPEVEKLVVRTSQLAHNFFERFGFQLIQTEKDYWGKGLDLYLMEQNII